MNRTEAKFEFGLGILLMIAAIAIGAETFKIPNMAFDPLGGRAVPFWVSVFVALLSVNMAFQGYLALRANASSVGQGGGISKEAVRHAIGMVILTLIYVMAFHFDVNFEFATSAFVGLSISHLSGWRKHWIGYGFAIALVAAFGLHYLFTEVLVIDLP